MSASERELLERIAREYTHPDPGRTVDRKFIALTADRILPWVAGPEVLELGVGDDQWTSRIIELYGHSSIVDGSASLLALAREKYGTRVTTYTSLFEEFSPGKSFDTIIASTVLEHVEDPPLVLGRLSRWLTPGGHIIIVVPHADSIHRRLAVSMGMQPRTDELGATDRQMGHRRVYTIARMEQDIARAGLHIRRRRGLLLKPLPQGMLASFADAVLHGFMDLGDTMPMEFAALIAFDCVPTGS